jgi:hypothetical protein
MRNWATSLVVYVGAVIAVMALATLAGLHLRGNVNRAHRHWDAGVPRVIAQQQQKRREMESTALVSTANAAEAPDLTSDREPPLDEVAAQSLNGKATLAKEEESVAQKAQNESRRKNSRHVERKQQPGPVTAVTTLPQLVTTATSALIPFR